MTMTNADNKTQNKMNDIREDWFFNQHYSKDELNQLWEWSQKSGEIVDIKINNGKWSGFHIEDTEFTIDIAGQSTESDCRIWMERLGFKVRNKLN